MRPLLVLLAVALITFAPAITAHSGDHREHLSVTVEALPPASERTYRLAFEGGSFAAGWVFLAYGGVQGNASVELSLKPLDNSTTVAEWTWAPDGFHLNSTRLPFEDEYWLTLTNPSETDEVQVAFYYDQSCECLDKTVGLAGGPALFNLHVNADRTVAYDLIISSIASGEPIPPQGVRTEVTVTRMTNERALWPDDFEQVQKATTDRAVMSIEWTADEDGMYYVWVTPLTGATPQQPVLYRPSVDVSEAGGGAPGLGGALVFVAVLAALGLARFKGTR